MQYTKAVLLTVLATTTDVPCHGYTISSTNSRWGTSFQKITTRDRRKQQQQQSISSTSTLYMAGELEAALNALPLLAAPAAAFAAGQASLTQKKQLEAEVQFAESELEEVKRKLKDTDKLINGSFGLAVVSAGFVAAQAFSGGLPLPNDILSPKELVLPSSSEQLASSSIGQSDTIAQLKKMDTTTKPDSKSTKTDDAIYDSLYKSLESAGKTVGDTIETKKTELSLEIPAKPDTKPNPEVKMETTKTADLVSAKPETKVPDTNKVIDTKSDAKPETKLLVTESSDKTKSETKSEPGTKSTDSSYDAVFKSLESAGKAVGSTVEAPLAAAPLAAAIAAKEITVDKIKADVAPKPTIAAVEKVNEVIATIPKDKAADNVAKDIIVDKIKTDAAPKPTIPAIEKSSEVIASVPKDKPAADVVSKVAATAPPESSAPKKESNVEVKPVVATESKPATTTSAAAKPVDTVKTSIESTIAKDKAPETTAKAPEGTEKPKPVPAVAASSEKKVDNVITTTATTTSATTTATASSTTTATPSSTTTATASTTTTATPSTTTIATPSTTTIATPSTTTTATPATTTAATPSTTTMATSSTTTLATPSAEKTETKQTTTDKSATGSSSYDSIYKNMESAGKDSVPATKPAEIKLETPTSKDTSDVSKPVPITIAPKAPPTASTNNAVTATGSANGVYMKEMVPALRALQNPSMAAKGTNLPKFNAPDFKIPSMNKPDLKMPDISLPRGNLPGLPSINDIPVAAKAAGAIAAGGAVIAVSLAIIGGDDEEKSTSTMPIGAKKKFSTYLEGLSRSSAAIPNKANGSAPGSSNYMSNLEANSASQNPEFDFTPGFNFKPKSGTIPPRPPKEPPNMANMEPRTNVVKPVQQSDVSPNFSFAPKSQSTMDTRFSPPQPFNNNVPTQQQQEQQQRFNNNGPPPPQQQQRFNNNVPPPPPPPPPQTLNRNQNDNESKTPSFNFFQKAFDSTKNLINGDNNQGSNRQETARPTPKKPEPPMGDQNQFSRNQPVPPMGDQNQFNRNQPMPPMGDQNQFNRNQPVPPQPVNGKFDWSNNVDGGFTWRDPAPPPPPRTGLSSYLDNLNTNNNNPTTNENPGSYNSYLDAMNRSPQSVINTEEQQPWSPAPNGALGTSMAADQQFPNANQSQKPYNKIPRTGSYIDTL